jgi:co-chaperonin GroES (HSP10)
MKPIGKYIVINEVNEEVKSASGLFLSPEDMKSVRYRKGIVVNSGTDVDNICSGDTIYYDKVAGFTMMINETQYTVISERDVVVVL